MAVVWWLLFAGMVSVPGCRNLKQGNDWPPTTSINNASAGGITVTEAYPLYWPEGRQKTSDSKRQRSRFNTGFGAAVNLVFAELRRLDARNGVVSTNVPLRRDGLPLASAKRVDNPGVAIYFIYKNKQTCFACDRWDKVEDNIYAIAKTIEAMRGIARWGTGDMLDAAFTGFTALPPPPDWRAVLGCPKTIEDAEIKFRFLARQAHPDTGGSHERMSELNAAMEIARRELKS